MFVANFVNPTLGYFDILHLTNSGLYCLSNIQTTVYL